MTDGDILTPSEFLITLHTKFSANVIDLRNLSNIQRVMTS